MRSMFVFGAVLTIACSNKDPEPPPIRPEQVAAPPCDQAAAGLAHVATDQAGTPDVVARLYAAVEPAVLTRCQADRWPDDAVRCYAGLRTTADLTRCNLPEPMKTKLRDDMTAAMRSVANIVNDTK